MLHATCTKGNWFDSQLLVVGSQIINLTLSLSFGHNLCFRCPNGWCKPILDIYLSIIFQWYKKILNPLGFDPWNYSLNIQESTKTLTPKVGVPLGVWGPIPSLSCTLGSMRHGSWASLLACNLGTPCFGRKPKVLQPSLREWWWDSHSWNGDLGVLRDSQNFRVWLQGSKHLASECSLYYWKAIEV
jgi:hypothetical protein